VRDTAFLIVEFTEAPDATGRRVVAVWAAPFEPEARSLWTDLLASGAISSATTSALVEVPRSVADLFKTGRGVDG